MTWGFLVSNPSMEKADNSNKEAKTTKQKQNTLKTQRTSTVWRESDVLLALGKQQIDASEAILQYKRPNTANKKQNTKSNTENATKRELRVQFGVKVMFCSPSGSSKSTPLRQSFNTKGRKQQTKSKTQNQTQKTQKNAKDEYSLRARRPDRVSKG